MNNPNEEDIFQWVQFPESPINETEEDEARLLPVAAINNESIPSKDIEYLELCGFGSLPNIHVSSNKKEETSSLQLVPYDGASGFSEQTSLVSPINLGFTTPEMINRNTALGLDMQSSLPVSSNAGSLITMDQNSSILESSLIPTGSLELDTSVSLQEVASNAAIPYACSTATANDRPVQYPIIQELQHNRGNQPKVKKQECFIAY